MLEVTGLTAGYRRKPVLDGVSFTVAPGSFTVLLGRNGCGKSTLLACLSRQLTPWQGELRWRGQPLQRLRPAALAQTLCLLPQGLPAPGLTVAELVACGRTPWLSWGGQLSPTDRQQIHDAMALAGVTDLAHQSVPSLSGGERQRAYLAMTLAQDTPLLLLDEPTTYLDVAHQYQFLDTLSTLCRQQGKAVLAVLHDLPLALRYASQVLLLDGGRCVYDGAPGEALPALERTFHLRARWCEGHLLLDSAPAES